MTIHIYLWRICRIAVEKLSIIWIYAQFDLIFVPLEVFHALDKVKFLVFTIQVYL